MIVRRDELERLRADNLDLLEQRKVLLRANSKLGHARDKAYRDAGKVVDDLRVIRLHIESTPPYGREGRVGVSLEVADALIYDVYRRNGTFKEIIGHMIKEAFLRSPAGRSALIGGPKVTGVTGL